MSKKKTDDFDLDNELDFDNFDFGEIDGQITGEAKDKKSRSPVTEAFEGTIAGAKSVFTDPSFLAKATKDTLPSSYGLAFETADKAVGSLASLYDNAVKEIKPQAQNLAKKVDKLVPEESKKLKRITSKIKEFTGATDDSNMPSREQLRDRAMDGSLASIFQQQQARTDEVQAEANAKETVKEEVENQRFSSSQNYLKQITEGITTLSSYTTGVTQAVQKKGLELQFRTYFAISDLVESSKKFFEVARVQNESVIKNTALPEFVKIRNNERFREQAKTKFIDKLQTGLFNNNYVDTAIERLRAQTKEAIAGVKQGLEFASQGADAVEAVKEANKMAEESGIAPVSKTNLAFQMLAAGGVGQAQEWGSKKLREMIPEESKLSRVGNKTREVLQNVPAYADARLREEDLQNADFDTGLKGLVNRGKRWGYELLQSDTRKNNLTEGLDLRKIDDPTPMLQNRANTSLAEIIPGYLARIYREITVLNTGDQSTGLTSYDYQSGKFTSSKTLSADLKGRIVKSIKDSGHDYRLDKASKDFADGADDNMKKEIRGFFHDLSQTSMKYTPEAIQESTFFKKLSPEVQKRISEGLRSKITDSDLKEKGQADFTESIMNIQGKTPDAYAEIETYVRAGYGPLLEEQGIVKRNRSGGFDVDQEAYDKLIKDNTVVTSDINMKQGVSKLNSKEMLRSVKNTKLYNWAYKQVKGDKTPYQGPMAGDVKQNFGEEFAPGGKEMNLTNMNAASMAAIQELDRRQSKVDGQGDNTLKLIQKDTAKIVKFMTNGRGGRKGKRYPTGNDQGQQTAEGYQGQIQNIIGSLLNIGKNVVGDTITASKKVFDFGLNKIAKPLGSKAGELTAEYKEPVKELGKQIWDKTMKLSSRLISTGQNLLFNTLPEFAKGLKDKAIKLKDKIFSALEGPIDVFKKGVEGPILQANLMRMGFYYDQATGAVIKTFSDIKGPVVNKLGEVVLSVEDIGQGLYDNKGKPLLERGAKLAGAIGGYLRKGGERLMAAGKSLVDFLGKSKPGKWLKGKFDNIQIPQFELMGKSHDVLVEIRDILIQTLMGGQPSLAVAGGMRIPLMSAMNKIPSTPLGEQVMGAAQAKYNQGKSLFDGLLQKGKTKLGGFFGKQKSNAGGSDSSEGGPGEGSEQPGFFDGIKGSITDKLSDRGLPTTTEELKDRTRSKAQRLKETVRNKLKSVKDQVNTKIEDPETKKQALRAKRKAAVAIGRGKGKFSGLLGRAGGVLGSLGGIAGSLLGGSSPQEENPEEDQEDQPQKKQESKTEVSKPQGDASKATFNDQDGSGRRDGAWQEKLEARQEADKKRREEIEANKPQAAKTRYKGANVIDTMAEKAKGLFDMLSSGAGGLLGGAADLLGSLGGGKGGLLSKIGGFLKSPLGAAKAVGKAGLGAAKMVGGVGLAAVKNPRAAFTAVRTGLTIASLASGGVLGTVAGIGSLAMTAVSAVLASPVVLTGLAAAALAYGAYKGYKYFTRNNVNDFEAIRIKQYGFTNKGDDVNYNSKILELEGYLVEEGVIGFNGNEAQILPRKFEMEKVLEIFKIDKNNSEAVDNFTKWFHLRFKPFFLGAVTGLFLVDKKIKINQIDKLTNQQKVEYLEYAAQPGGPYDELTSPFPDKETLTNTKQLVEEDVKIQTKYLSALRAKEAEGKDKNQKKTDAPVKPQQKPDIPEKIQEKKPEATATQLAAEKAKNGKSEPITLGEDGPQKDRNVPDKPLGGALPSGNLKVAPGGLKDGASGFQFVSVAQGETLEGLSGATKKNFLSMAQEYGELTGKKIPVNAGARTYEMQAELHRKNPKKAAKPGYSMHEFGFAIDSNSGTIKELEDMGLMRKYGFTRPVGGETWHMEPAGIQTALSVAKNDPKSADDLVQISPGRGGGGIGSIPGSDLGKRDGAYAKNLWAQAAQEVSQVSVKSELPTGPAKAVDVDKKDSAGVINEKAGEQGRETAAPAPRSKAAEITTAKLSDTKSVGVPDGEVKPSEQKSDTGSAPTSKEEVKKKIESVAQKTGVEPKTMTTLAAVESGLNPFAKASGTSAKGPFQMLDGTWNETLDKYGSKYGLSANASPFDVTASTLMASEYVKSNEKMIKSVKPDININDTYLTHFLGPGGARSMLKALKDNPDAIAASILPKAAASNPTLFGSGGKQFTVREFYDNIGRLLQKKANAFGVTIPPTMTSLAGEATREQSAQKASEKDRTGTTAANDTSVSGINVPKQTLPSQTAGQTSTGNGDVPAQIEPVTAPTLKKGLFTPPTSLMSTGSTRIEKGESSGLQSAMEGATTVLNQQLTVLEKINSNLDDIKGVLASKSSEATNQGQTQKPAPGQPVKPGRPTPSKITPAVDLRRTA